MFLNGDAINEPDRRGEPIVDDSFLVLFNAQPDPATFTLPPAEYGQEWTAVMDTDSKVRPGARFRHDSAVLLEARSLVVLTRPPAGE